MQQLPSSSPADQLASQYQLGKLRDIYVENKLSEQIMRLIASFFILAIAAYILRQINPPLSLPFLLVLLIALGALYSTIKSALAVISNYRQRGTGSYSYEHGLLRLQYNNGALVHSDVILWQNIAIVWHEVKEVTQGEDDIRRLHLYRLQLKDGTLFGGEDYSLGPGPVMTAILQETMRAFWPETLDRYQRGLPVIFGPLTISQQGIQYENRQLLWSDISIIDCSGSTKNVTINMHREKAKLNGWPIQIHIPRKEVPNIHILRRLLIFAREQQPPPHFVLHGVFSKDVAKALSPIN